MSRMSQVERATERYPREIKAAADPGETTSHQVQAHCAQVVDAAEKMVAAAKAEAEGVEANAIDAAERSITEATRRLDEQLAEALGARPPPASSTTAPRCTCGSVTGSQAPPAPHPAATS